MTAKVEAGRTRLGDVPVGLFLRVLLLIAMVLSGWQVLRQSQALDLALPRNGIAGLEQSIGRDPSYSRAQFLLGMVRRDLPGFEDLNAAVEHFAKAVGLNPYSWRYRLEQSRALELAGSLVEAEEALAEAVRLNPRSGAYRWRLANFQLRHGTQEDAVQEIGTAINLDPSLQPPALAILLKLGLDFDQIDGIWPTDQVARLRLLRGLCASLAASRSDVGAGLAPARSDGSMSEPELRESSVGAGLAPARSLWTELLATKPSLSMNEGRFYPQFLLASGQPRAAKEAWLELASGNGLLDSEFESGRDAIWNGGFELPLQGRPLGWVLARSDDFTAKLVQGEGFDGAAALGVEFLGKKNLNFAGLSQDLVVEPGMEYQLTVRMRTGEISTDEGLFLEVVEKTNGRVLFSTVPVRGTEDWREESGLIQVPDETAVLMLRLRRRPSGMLDNKIRGKIWLDKVSLEPVGP